MSGTDRLRVESNERVDLPDFDFAVDNQVTAAFEQLGGQFFTDPTGDRAWILDGFLVDNVDGAPLGGVQVRSVLGRAILSRRELGEVTHGLVTTLGDAEKIIDISTFSNGTYGAYIRFQYVDGDNASRAFWDSSSGQEFNQAIPTRRKANWSMRIELTNPGAEWLKIADVTITAGAVTALVDTRPFYFEGKVDDTYESGWSDDGGGVADDRNADRQQYGIKDLQTFVRAMRQSIEDIKGRGLARWWDRDIQGMNVGDGFTGLDPVQNRIALGDVDFAMVHNSPSATSAPSIYFDGSNVRLDYFRNTGFLAATFNSIVEFRVSTAGASVSNGLTVGFLATPTDDAVSVRDSQFRMDFQTANVPKIIFETSSGESSFRFQRAGTEHFEWLIDGTEEMALYPTGFNSIEGGRVGFSGAPTTGHFEMFDANFYTQLNLSNPEIYFDQTGGADLIRYDRTNNQWDFVIAGTNGIKIGNVSGLVTQPAVFWDEPNGAYIYFDRTLDFYSWQTNASNGNALFLTANTTTTQIAFGLPFGIGATTYINADHSGVESLNFVVQGVSMLFLDDGQQARFTPGNSSTESVVRIDTTSTTGAPLELEPKAPTTDLGAGRITVDPNNDQLNYCDSDSEWRTSLRAHQVTYNHADVAGDADPAEQFFSHDFAPGSFDPSIAGKVAIFKFDVRLRLVAQAGAPEVDINLYLGDANSTSDILIFDGSNFLFGGGVGQHMRATITGQFAIESGGAIYGASKGIALSQDNIIPGGTSQHEWYGTGQFAGRHTRIDGGDPGSTAVRWYFHGYAVKVDADIENIAVAVSYLTDAETISGIDIG